MGAKRLRSSSGSVPHLESVPPGTGGAAASTQATMTVAREGHEVGSPGRVSGALHLGAGAGKGADVGDHEDDQLRRRTIAAGVYRSSASSFELKMRCSKLPSIPEVQLSFAGAVAAARRAGGLHALLCAESQRLA